MLPIDKYKSIEYQNKMYELKERNRKEFWSNGKKMKFLFQLNKFHFFRSLINKISPYELVEIKRDVNYFSPNRIAIYTSIFGNYDEVIEPLCLPDNCDFFIICDGEIDENSSWKKVNVDEFNLNIEKLTNVEKNRFFKMFPNKIFPDYQYSIYIDGNIKIHTDLTEYIHSMNLFGIKMHNHYRRNCVYKEIEKCIELKKDTIDNLLKHKEYLLNQGMPREYGMLEAPIIVREHHNPKCIKLMNDWWNEFNKFSKRDQISLPYVLWKNGIKINEVSLLGNDLYSNYSFSKKKHIK